MTVNTKSFGAGMTFLAVAALYGGTTLRTISLGTLTDMGPGFFPAVLCIILAGLGATLVIRSWFEKQERAFSTIAWRALLTVSGSIVFFGFFVRQIGLAPAVFISASVCSLAATETKPLTAAIIGLALATFAVLVFIYGLRLPLPIFGTMVGW
jgi:hypothetical protein